MGNDMKTAIKENRMEKIMENEMDTREYSDYPGLQHMR